MADPGPPAGEGAPTPPEWFAAPVEPPIHPGEVPPPSPPTPPRPPRPRRGVAIGAAAGVIAVVVVVALLVVGVIPGLNRPGGLASSLTFSQAESAAATSSGSVSGGPWSAIAALGVQSSSARSVTVSTTNLSGPVAGCVGTTLRPVSSLSLPSSAGSFAGGLSGAWVVLLHNGTGAVLVVLVADGVSTPVYLASGGGLCQLIGSDLASLPSGVIDSPTAVRTALDAGGSAFLAAHPRANLTMEILGGIAVFGFSTNPTWQVQIADCPAYSFNDTVATAPAFNATIDAVTGSVRATHNATVSCRGLGSARTPLGTALAVAPPTAATAGPYCWYNASIQSAADGLTLGDLEFQFADRSGIVVPDRNWTLNVVGISGSSLAAYGYVPGTWVWTTASRVVVTDQMTIELYSSNTPLAGENMVITGTGPFSGSISVPIP
ncbi:MAG TPA: hypothetical protein VFF67_00670 [Thermoplasmata archaeon]|nr:hypothetical protein [Thermoplasmata archaeon]